MANPNKTVGNFRRKNGFAHSDAAKARMEESRAARLEHSRKTNWAVWAMDQVSRGVVFSSMEEAEKAFENRPQEDRV